ncbi:sugar phosphate isomerase/epimerase family protein [Vibrio astriarenae]
MKLSVSNFAWPQHQALWCYEQLAKRNIKGIEIAPTKVFGDQWCIEAEHIAELKQTLSLFDLEVSSLQGLTYGKPDLALHGEGSVAFLQHMQRIVEIMQSLEAEIAVFGAAKLRQCKPSDVQEIYALFEQLGYRFAISHKTLTIEPIPKAYGAQYLSTLSECKHLVNVVNQPGFALTFDTANAFLSGDLMSGNYKNVLHKAKHVHVSEPDLCYFHQPSKFNIELAGDIKRHYQGQWVVLEMGDKHFTRSGFVRSLDNFARLYAQSS